MKAALFTLVYITEREKRDTKIDKYVRVCLWKAFLILMLTSKATGKGHPTFKLVKRPDKRSKASGVSCFF